MRESTDYYMYVSTYTQGDPKDRLKTEKRPKQVKEFLAYGRILGRRPQMKSVEEYGQAWNGWHEELKVKANYEDMQKGGGNGIFLLVLGLRWWGDASNELNEGEEKTKSNSRLREAITELDQSMAGILKLGALQAENEVTEDEEIDMEIELRNKKR